MKLSLLSILAIIFLISQTQSYTLKEIRNCWDKYVMQECSNENKECIKSMDAWKENYKNSDKCEKARDLDNSQDLNAEVKADDYGKCYEDIKDKDASETFKLYFYNPKYNCVARNIPFTENSQKIQKSFSDVDTCINQECIGETPSLNLRQDMENFDNKFKTQCHDAWKKQYQIYQDKKFDDAYPFEIRSCNNTISATELRSDFVKMFKCAQDCSIPKDGKETGAQKLYFSAILVLSIVLALI